MKKSGAQIIVKLLELYGVEVVSGIPGGSILPLYDELSRSGIRHILVRQEQAAGFIAQGISRSTGKIGVCLATSGPGAMNLLTSIADARSDSVPLIAITGQVNTGLLGTDAFQEADTFGLSFPITKHSMMVKSARELLTAIPLAFKIAVDDRPGPVLIDVPRDVQLEVCEFDEWPEQESVHVRNIRYHTPPHEYAEKMDKITDLLAQSRRPVLYCGGGCNSFDAALELIRFLKSYRLPVVTSLMGIGCVPKSHEMFIGMVGMHGSYAANYAMSESDLVIAAGVRFDDRATGKVSAFCPNAKIVHIDVDAAEINKILPSYISVVADVESVFPILVRLSEEKQDRFGAAWQAAEARARWLEKIRGLKEYDSQDAGRAKNTALTNPRALISRIPDLAREAGEDPASLIITTDVGQHQMWVAQYYPIERPKTLLTSGSLGTMGFGLPAAIGAALANPGRRVVCFSGDGSIMMNIQELATLYELNLPVTVIVLQNGTLGMVYQQQKYLFNGTYSASVFESKQDLVSIAAGFGIEALDADKDPDWHKKAFAPDRNPAPCFVKVSIAPEEDVLPFVPGGKANIDAILS